MPPFYKEPSEKLDYSYKWSLAAGDSVTQSVWTSTPAGLTLSDESFDASSDPTDPPDTWLTVVWISGGTDGTDYELTNEITTLGGREDVQSATVRVGKEIVPAAGILASLPGGSMPGAEVFDLQDAREIVDGMIARVAAKTGGAFRNDAYARMVARDLAQAKIWGDVLRRSGHLAAEETTKEEDRANARLKEYDAATALPAERGEYITTWPVARG